MADVKITTTLDGVAGVKAGFESMSGAVKTAAAAMATALAGIGVVKLIKDTIDAGDQIQKLSQKIGASTEALSQYKHVAGLAGVSLEQLAQGWQFMSRSISDASQGTGAAADALDELGLSASKLKTLAPEHQFEVIAEALDGVKNASDKTRLASDLFGARQTALLQVIEGGSAALLKGREEANSYGLTLSRVSVDNMAAFNDGMERMKNAGLGVINMFAVHMGPTLQSIGEFLGSVLPQATKFFVSALDGMRIFGLKAIEGIAYGFAQFLALIGKLPGEVGASAQAASEWFTKLQKNTNDLADTYTVATMEVKDFTVKQGASVEEMKLATGETNKNAAAVKEQTKVVKEAKEVGLSYEQSMELVREAEEENNLAKERSIKAYKDWLEPAGMTIDAHGEIVDIEKKAIPIIHDHSAAMEESSREFNRNKAEVMDWGKIFRQEHHTVLGTVTSVVWDLKGAWHGFFGAVIAEGGSFKGALSALWGDIKNIILRKLAEIVADALWNQLANLITGKTSALTSLGNYASTVLAKITGAQNAANTLPTGGAAGGSGAGGVGATIGAAAGGAAVGAATSGIFPGGNSGRDAGSTAGGAIGAVVGGPVGAVVGSFIGGAIGGIIGGGDGGPAYPRMRVSVGDAGYSYSGIDGRDFGAAGVSTAMLAASEISQIQGPRQFLSALKSAVGAGSPVYQGAVRSMSNLEVIGKDKTAIVSQARSALTRIAQNVMQGIPYDYSGDGNNIMSQGQFSALKNMTRGFATGGQAVFSRPTLISVAEAGPEMISARPMASGAQGGGGSLVFNGPVFFDELSLNRFQRGMAAGLERVGARY